MDMVHRGQHYFLLLPVEPLMGNTTLLFLPPTSSPLYIHTHTNTHSSIHHSLLHSDFSRYNTWVCLRTADSCGENNNNNRSLPALGAVPPPTPTKAPSSGLTVEESELRDPLAPCADTEAIH